MNARRVGALHEATDTPWVARRSGERHCVALGRREATVCRLVWLGLNRDSDTSIVGEHLVYAFHKTLNRCYRVLALGDLSSLPGIPEYEEVTAEDPRNVRAALRPVDGVLPISLIVCGEPTVYRAGALPKPRRNKLRGKPMIVEDFLPFLRSPFNPACRLFIYVGDSIIVVKLNGVESNVGEALDFLRELHGSPDLRTKWISSFVNVPGSNGKPKA